jgi:hypothetical protein
MRWLLVLHLALPDCRSSSGSLPMFAAISRAKASAAMLSGLILRRAATTLPGLHLLAQKPLILLTQNSPSNPTEPPIGVSSRLCGRLASRKERQVQNHLSGFILYDHHKGRIVVRVLFSQLQDFALGIRKCRRNIRQVRTMRVILNPVRSAYYCEEISRHLRTRLLACSSNYGHGGVGSPVTSYRSQATRTAARRRVQR